MNIVDIKNNEATQKTVVKFIEDYELSHSEEVWEKEAEKIYSTGGEEPWGVFTGFTGNNWLIVV